MSVIKKFKLISDGTKSKLVDAESGQEIQCVQVDVEVDAEGVRGLVHLAPGALAIDVEFKPKPEPWTATTKLDPADLEFLKVNFGEANKLQNCKPITDFAEMLEGVKTPLPIEVTPKKVNFREFT